jgi:OOP family OmpA-OmpF porin
MAFCATALGFDRSNANYVTVGLNYAFDRPAAPYVRTAMEPEPARVVVAEAPPAPLPAPTPAAPLPPPAPRFEKFTLSATELLAFDRDQLQSPQPKLDEIAGVLSRYTDVTNVVITGYADNIGSDKYNQNLSERRAMAVKNYLVNKGVSANRMRAVGRGEAYPVVTCTNKNRPALIKCLEPNRRVEVEQITIERRV